MHASRPGLILALCLVKSSSEMASTSSNSCSSRICFMYADLSEAANFGVAAVPVAWGCQVHVLRNMSSFAVGAGA